MGQWRWSRKALRRLLPTSLGASIRQLAVEKLPSGAGFDLAVRDGKTGFVFFNVEGDQYDYDANAKLLSITGGRLLVSNEFAKALGRASAAGAVAGEISIGATMQPDRDHTARRKRRREIRQAASSEPTWRWDCPRPRRHRRRADRLCAIGQWCSEWPRGALFGNRCLQQRDDRRGLVCPAEQRPSLYSSEFLPNEWRR